MSTTTTNLTPSLTNIATQSKQTMTSLWENTSKLMNDLDETFQTYLLYIIIITTSSNCYHNWCMCYWH